jgi:hypothetical protein
MFRLKFLFFICFQKLNNLKFNNIYVSKMGRTNIPPFFVAVVGSGIQNPG